MLRLTGVTFSRRWGGFNPSARWFIFFSCVTYWLTFGRAPTHWILSVASLLTIFVSVMAGAKVKYNSYFYRVIWAPQFLSPLRSQWENVYEKTISVKKLAFFFFSFLKTKVLHFPACTAQKSRQQAGAFYKVRRFLQPLETKRCMTTCCSSRVQVSVWRRFDKLDHWCLTKAACTPRGHIWCCCRECGDGESSANFEEIM